MEMCARTASCSSEMRGGPSVKTALDIPRLTELMTGLADRGQRQHTIAIVLPLREGMSEVAAEFLAEGPPFDPKKLGLARHQVFLTESEIVFVFETEKGLATLDEILAEPDFWTVASTWEHVMAGQPRIGTTIFEWPEHQRPSGS